MSSSNKNSSCNFYCDVCKINILTEAEYALHEFSKKHSDNLLRIAKNKPVVSKQKAVKAEPVKEVPKVNVVTTQGNFAKYGYFVHGEVYDTRIETREFNTDYDPYVQKYGENPFRNTVPTVIQPFESPLAQTMGVTSFKKKKKRKIRTCQICNLTLSTVPEYEAHMRSPQHSWKLKMSGMGVSAHFVKASTDLHTIEVKEETTVNESNPKDEASTVQSEISVSSSSFNIFPTLYCDVCELLLNSEQQYNAHVNGKAHNENVQRKAEIKAKKMQLESPSPDKLYCYSCKVSLNNLYQYNEHKFGKKHKMKCRRLMKDGITIPPEERVSSWGFPRLDPNKPVIYPELYEKCVLEAKKKTADGNIKGENYNCNEEFRIKDISDQVSENLVPDSGFSSNAVVESHIERPVNDGHSLEDMVHEPVIKDTDQSAVPNYSVKDSSNVSVVSSVENAVINPNIFQENESKLLKIEQCLKCSICLENFEEHQLFEHHLAGEEHARKVLAEKESGKPDGEILEVLFREKSAVKPDRLGRWYCSICCVTTGNALEYGQHIDSVLHKQSEEDFRKKRKLEIQFAVNKDGEGKFTCKLCHESWDAVVEYNQHLHTIKHRESIKADRARKMMAKKRAVLLQQRRVKQKYKISGLKRKNFAFWRKKCEKNPGVRTKIAGMVTDLQTGVKESIPNLETLEPKIDSTRNVSLGAAESVVIEEKKPMKRSRRTKRKHHGDRGRHSEGQYSRIKPLIRLPMNGHRSFNHRPMQHSMNPPPLDYFRNWNPCPDSYQFSYYSGVSPFPYPVNRYQRNFQPCWSRFPPFYR